MNKSSKISSLVPNWENRMRKSGKKFARLVTTRAVYDRVAIIDSNSHSLVFQWPKGSPRRGTGKNINSANCGNESFTIKQEMISQANIKDIRYYKS